MTGAVGAFQRTGVRGRSFRQGHLFAHCTTRVHYIVRQGPFAAAHLVDRDLTVDFAELTTPSDGVAVIATTPLTDNERWTPIEPGRVVAFRDGAPVEEIGRR